MYRFESYMQDMTRYNLKKKQQLGEDAGTASNRLKKRLLFKYVCAAGDNICYRCGDPIIDIEEFSMEHKEVWLDSNDPVGMFHDLENIGFSHLSCNVKAARRREAKCGTQNKYNKGCRCDRCKEKNRQRSRYKRAKALVAQMEEATDLKSVQV